MIYPTIDQLTKGEYNRYQLAIATAKCARIITDEYVKQRTAAESTLTGSKEGGGSIVSLIDQDLADKKAVKNAIDHIYNGDYEIKDGPTAAEEQAPEVVTD
ncbi:MAG: DNA-directed RNA polymerase subunit omega [Ruminococcaceae bacterium]|nr:DNA-directed RNA polymerase subunit omega [Oscillospiraceae bacterium]